ncbi:spore germination protein KC [Paenibacillus mucilaginosus]|uniref:Ger(x)C family spore germination protein n=1 Tax=Paenibacillus mucilaginosus TaxID=61624 RepID=UPI003D230A03
MRAGRLKARSNLLLVMLLVFPLLAGCWDRQEIEERAVVLGIGVDVADPAEERKETESSHERGALTAEETGLLRLTVQIAVPGRIPLGPGEGGGGGGGQRTVWVVDAVGHTIGDAINTLQQRVSPPLFFGHLRIIVISEALARKGIKNLNDYFRRNPEVRRMNWMFVSQGSAAGIMRASPQLERVPTLYLMTTMDQSVKMGRFPNDFLGIFWSAVSSKGKEGYLPYVELMKEQNVQISGLAYFRGDRMVGSTNPIQIPVYMGIMGISMAGGQTFVRIPGTEELFMFQGRSRKSVFKVRIENGKPVIRVTVALEGNLISKFNETLQLSSEVVRQIEAQLSQQSKEASQNLIALTQEKRADIFGFGEQVRAKEPDYWNTHIRTKDAWQKQYQELKVEMDVRVHVRRVGMKAT